MDGVVHHSIAALAPDVFCVTMNGLSKSHMVAGFRCGWMVLSGPKERAKGYIEGLNMLSNMRLCSNVPAQSIVQTALGGFQSVQEYLQPGGRIYEQREYFTRQLIIPGSVGCEAKSGFLYFSENRYKAFSYFG